VDRFLDFFFLQQKRAQKRKRNGMNVLFYKNMENIFSYLLLIAFKKKKAT